MFKYLFYIFFAAILAAGSNANAQPGEFFTDSHGKAIVANYYKDVEGSPYVFAKWLPGKVITDKGRVYDGLKVKYNAYDDVLTFLYDTEDEPLKFADPIKSFVMFAPQVVTFANGFPAIDKQTEDSYYQVLSYGKVSFLKRYIKDIKETKEYNSSAITKTFTQDIEYYVYKDKKITAARRNKSAIVELMADKTSQIDSYISKNDINFKKDDDLKKLFDYYNTL